MGSIWENGIELNEFFCMTQLFTTFCHLQVEAKRHSLLDGNAIKVTYYKERRQLKSLLSGRYQGLVRGRALERLWRSLHGSKAEPDVE